MRLISALVELAVLVVVASAIGFAAAAWRDDGLDVRHNYSPARKPGPAAPPPAGSASSGDQYPGAESPAAAHESDGHENPAATGRSSAQPSTADHAVPGDHAASGDDSEFTAFHPEHEFQTMTADRIVQLLDDAETQAGLNVFIDARSEKDFRAGRIPGALLCDHYQPKKYLPLVEDAVLIAERVIVYCGGGECEDSILTSRELETTVGVLRERLYLYEGGWKEWTARKLPVERD